MGSRLEFQQLIVDDIAACIHAHGAIFECNEHTLHVCRIHIYIYTYIH